MGGLTTVERYGAERMRVMGRENGHLGGRPTIAEAAAKAWNEREALMKRMKRTRREIEVAPSGPTLADGLDTALPFLDTSEESNE